MSAHLQPLLPFTAAKVRRQRETQKDRVEKFFLENLGVRITSRELHWKFGSAVRTRISEINKDSDSRIRITNETVADQQGVEHSAYRAEKK